MAAEDATMTRDNCTDCESNRSLLCTRHLPCCRYCDEKAPYEWLGIPVCYPHGKAIVA